MKLIQFIMFLLIFVFSYLDFVVACLFNWEKKRLILLHSLKEALKKKEKNKERERKKKRKKEEDWIECSETYLD